MAPVSESQSEDRAASYQRHPECGRLDASRIQPHSHLRHGARQTLAVAGDFDNVHAGSPTASRTQPTKLFSERVLFVTGLPAVSHRERIIRRKRLQKRRIVAILTVGDP